VTFVAGFRLLDLVRYAVHRCEHAVPLFWRFHALHHSDPDVDVTTSVRHHPIEYVVASAVYWLAMLLLNVPVIVVVSHGLAVFGMASLQHGNIRLPQWTERWLEPVVVTTGMHRIHHSVVFAQANSKYGAVLSIWDRFFGTYIRISRAEQERLVFGVRELPRRECLRPSAMLLTPWLISRGPRLEVTSSYKRLASAPQDDLTSSRAANR
jgi:sterol desaturase/sphingolipid hydroxylase (fatty acid hydroxylase superfamily)